MKRFLFLSFLSINLISVSLHSQDLSGLLKEDFDRKSQLLIQNELRKSLGSRSSSPEVQKIVKNLLPWSRMEEFSPRQFAQAVTYLHESDKAGIPFESNEELLPLLIQYKGPKEDFLILSRFMHEAEESKLPTLFRDELIARGLDKKWDPLSVLVAGRLLVLSRKESDNTAQYFSYLLKEMNPRFSRLSEKQSNELIQKLTKDFVDEVNIKNISQIQNDLTDLKKARGSNLTSVLVTKSRNLDVVWEEYGDLELRKRPPAFVNEIIPSSEDSSEEPEILTDSWKILETRNLKSVVQGWIGTRYKFGGNTKAGVDCSGFTLHVLIDPKIKVPKSMIPRRASHQAKIGTKVSNSSMRQGDLVFFSASPNQSKITHVGLVMENRNFSHASSTRGVVIQSLDSKWWRERFVTSRRIFQKVK